MRLKPIKPLAEADTVQKVTLGAEMVIVPCGPAVVYSTPVSVLMWMPFFFGDEGAEDALYGPFDGLGRICQGIAGQAGADLSADPVIYDDVTVGEKAGFAYSWPRSPGEAVVPDWGYSVPIDATYRRDGMISVQWRAPSGDLSVSWIVPEGAREQIWQRWTTPPR